MSDLSPIQSPPLTKMEDPITEVDLEISYNSEPSVGDKRKREGKVRSKVWQYFTKIMKEDGTCDKCQCNHCRKQFTCSSRSGTTHLLRHIADGICPVFKKDKNDVGVTMLSSTSTRGNLAMERRNAIPPWKFDPLGQCSTTRQYPYTEVELLPNGVPGFERQTYKTTEVEYGSPAPLPSREKLPQQSQLKGEAWMCEFRSCVAKLVELTNGKIPVGSLQVLAVDAPDYSIANALRCLNEMEDIPQSSEMYLDAFEILQSADERECFVCLPPEPRRRWLQRTLHRRHPSRYSSSCGEC